MLRVVKLIVGGLVASVMLHIPSNNTYASEKQIYGLHEHVYVPELKVGLEAKLDTGAYTSSLSATSIHEFERDGDPWVRFKLSFDDAPGKTYELPIVRVSKIKKRADDLDDDIDQSFSTRPVVLLHVHMGNTSKTIEVNLTDRSAFKYPFLLGSKALRKFNAVIDPSVRFTAEKPKK